MKKWYKNYTEQKSLLDTAKQAVRYKPVREHWENEIITRGLPTRGQALAYLRHTCSNYDDVLKIFMLKKEQATELRNHVNRHFVPYIQHLE